MYEIKLNSGRSCLRYIIRAFDIKEIYVPFYTCPVVWQTLKHENCLIHFYHINNNFLPDKDLPENAYVLYTNYFGICAGNVKNLAKKYKNLIVDNAQAFFMPECGIASFNSIRKFLPVKDGAVLKTKNKLKSCLKQDITKINNNDCAENEESINSKEILLLSERTKKITETINTKEEKTNRLSNFNIYNSSLKNINEIEINLDEEDVPMYYPFLTYNTKIEEELKINKIPAERLWNPLPLDTQEGIFQKYLILLPLSSNYNTNTLQRIINIIKKNK